MFSETASSRPNNNRILNYRLDWFCLWPKIFLNLSIYFGRLGSRDHSSHDLDLPGYSLTPTHLNYK